MNAQHTKAMLPVIIAFANRIPVQYRPLSPGALQPREWMTINPDTTEFRLTDDVNPEEWRVHPHSCNVPSARFDCHVCCCDPFPCQPESWEPSEPLQEGDLIKDSERQVIGSPGAVQNWQSISNLLITLKALDPTINPDEALSEIIEESKSSMMSVEEILRERVEKIRREGV